MGPRMSARMPPADKAVMLIGQRRCINGDRPITPDTATAPEWWLLIASTAAETTTSWRPCSTSSSSNLAVGSLGFPPPEPSKPVLTPTSQSSPRPNVVCSDERTQLRQREKAEMAGRGEWCCVPASRLRKLSDAEPPREPGVWSPAPVLLPVPGHHPATFRCSSAPPRLGAPEPDAWGGGGWACSMQPTLRHRSPMQAGAINVVDGAIDKRGLRPTSSPTTGQENSRT